MKMKALWRRHFVGSIYERCRSSTRRNVISWVQSYNKNGHNSERGQLSPVQMERRRRNIVICTDIFTNPCRFSSRATAQRSPPVQRAERSTISLVSSIVKLAPSRKNHSNFANFPRAIKGLIALENLKIQPKFKGYYVTKYTLPAMSVTISDTQDEFGVQLRINWRSRSAHFCNKNFPTNIFLLNIRVFLLNMNPLPQMLEYFYACYFMNHCKMSFRTPHKTNKTRLINREINLKENRQIWSKIKKCLVRLLCCWYETNLTKAL